MNGSIFATEETAPRIPLEVEALIIALQLGEPDTSLLKRLSDDEWTKLFAFAKIANLTLPLALLPMEGFPHWVVERLITNRADNALRFARVKATYREAAEALERAGIEHIVIKGFTQSPDYVADPRLRLQNDIDFFCPPESVEAAYSALTAIGYEPFSASPIPRPIIKRLSLGTAAGRGEAILSILRCRSQLSCTFVSGTSPFRKSISLKLNFSGSGAR